MSLRSGLAGQVGFAEETTPGTRVAPALFLPVLSESMEDNQGPLESGAIIANRVVMTAGQRNGGAHKVGGDVQLELYDHGIALLLKHMFGALATTGAGPYVHTATPAAIDGKALTVQVGRPDTSGTVHPFDFLGCKVSEWELAVKHGEIATLGLTFVGMTGETSDTLATATYPSNLKPVKFLHGALEIGGDAVPISEASIKAARNLADSRYVIGSGNVREPLQEGLQEYTASATCEFESLTQYNHYVNHDDVAFDLTFTVGANSLEITGNVRLDFNGPKLDGAKLLTQALPMKFLATDAGADSTGIQAVLTDSTATP